MNMMSSRPYTIDTGVGRFMQTRQELERRIMDEYAAQPIPADLDERDVRLIMRQTSVDRERVQAYLRYFGGDIVDTILCLQEHHNMWIPEFRERERPPLEEAYVQRSVVDRIPTGRGGDDGYESA